MNKGVKKKWVEALLSGKYIQGHGYLRTSDDKFCCLGVLCDLAVKEGVIPKETKDRDISFLYAGSSAFLPTAVVEWSGLPHADSDKDGRLTTESLAADNDGGVPFSTIADTIDAYF